MINKVAPGEIVYCNLVIRYKKKVYKLDKIVYKNDGELFFHRARLKELKITEPVKIESIDVMARLGFENKSKEFTEVKGSIKDIRNVISGAYE